MKYLIIILCLVTCSCGPAELITLPSLSAQQPKIISVIPKDKSTAAPDSKILVTMTKEVDVDSVNKDSFVVVENIPDKTAGLIADEISDGKLVGIEGEYKVSDDKFSILFTPSNKFLSGITYGVVLTNKISTIDNFKLPDTIVSRFKVEDNSQVTQADTDNLSTETLESSDENAQALTEESPELSSETVVLENLVINEIYYDAAGSDTNGDLFVELYGTVGGDLSGYKVVFVNGEDGKVTATITLPSGAEIPESGLYVISDDIPNKPNTTLVESANYIANFDPHNGPDVVQLLDKNEKMLDIVCYGNVTLPMCEGKLSPDAPSGQSVSRTNGEGEFIINQTPTPGGL